MRRLDAIYARLPTVQCKGLCYESCSMIAYSAAERRRIEDAGEAPPSVTMVNRKGVAVPQCDKLDIFQRCSIYEHRPLVCRMYGASERLECPFGCRPDRYLSEPEERAIFEEIMDLEGPDPESTQRAVVLNAYVRSLKGRLG